MLDFILFVAFCCLIYALFKTGHKGLAIFLSLLSVVWALFSLGDKHNRKI